jgi:hypothetical protein
MRRELTHFAHKSNVKLLVLLAVVTQVLVVLLVSPTTLLALSQPTIPIANAPQYYSNVVAM